MNYDELNKAADEGKNLGEPQLETSPVEIPPVVAAPPIETPPVATVPPVEIPPVLPVIDDNAERSQLGRKVKELTETVTNLQQIIVDSYTKPPVSASTNDSDEFTVPTTLEEFRATMNKIKADEEKGQQVYSNSYLEKVAVLGSNEPYHSDIVNEMMTNFNIRRSDSGPNDAMINYYQAKASILAKKMAQPVERVNPFLGVPPAAPTGVGGGGVPPQTPVAMPILDPDSERYVNYLARTTGKSREDIVKSLSDMVK